MTPRATLTGVPLTLAVLLLGATAATAQHAVRTALDGRPDAIVDLRTESGVALVGGGWQYQDARVVPAQNRAPGPDLRPSGEPVATLDIAPRIGGMTSDDRGWAPIAAASLEARRTNGKLSFGWYRTTVTVPTRVGALATTGSTIVFEVVVDDYAEIWVDGRNARVLGQTGGSVVRGFNAPNRIVLTREARPGQQFQLAVFAANGPLSDPPSNFVWVRSATLDFFAPAAPARVSPARVVRANPGLDAIIPQGATIEALAEGFLFTEGPVWHPDGYLLFSDPNANTVYRWSDDDGLSVYRVKSGYTGVDVGEYGQPGSNGLALDAEGRLTVDEHGNRRVVRYEHNGRITVLADQWNGKPLNAPNDAVVHPDGGIWFTDPGYGSMANYEGHKGALQVKEAVYRIDPKTGKMDLVTDEIHKPNGLCFSPDYKKLYIADTGGPDPKPILVWDLDGARLKNRRPFCSMEFKGKSGVADGIRADIDGNIWAGAGWAGDGYDGVQVFAPEGERIGLIKLPEICANLCFGGEKRNRLFMAASQSLYAVYLETQGAHIT